jgi:hypothetical protein
MRWNLVRGWLEKAEECLEVILIAVIVGLVLVLVFEMPARAAAFSGLSVKAGSPAPPGAVPWSTLGIVTDGVTDNTAALNALSTANPIYADCTLNGIMLFAGQWFLKSGLKIYVQPGCIWVTTFAAATDLGFASISQSDITTALDTVLIDGAYLKRLEPQSQAASLHRSVFLNVNHFTYTHFTFDVFHQAFYLLGSDVEIAYGVTKNGCTVIGCDGVRQIGNIPKVSSSLPANWYVHDNIFVTGDGPFQACQPTATGIGANKSTDDILYLNNFGTSSAATLILIGEDVLTPSQSNVTCTNIVFRNTNGSGAQVSTKISSSYAPMIVQHITVDGGNLTTSKTTSAANIQVYNKLGGTLDDVVIKNVHVVTPYERSLEVAGGTHFTLQTSTLDEPVTAGLANAQLHGDTSSTLTGNTISAHLGAALVLGLNSLTPTQTAGATVSGNTFNKITRNQSGVLLQNVDSSTVSSNVMLRGPSQIQTRGATFVAGDGTNPGVTNTTVTGNNMANMNNNPVILFSCNGGTTNSATGNTGSPDYTCH